MIHQDVIHFTSKWLRRLICGSSLTIASAIYDSTGGDDHETPLVPIVMEHNGTIVAIKPRPTHDHHDQHDTKSSSLLLVHYSE